MGQIHLFPDLGYGIRINPLVISWAADVIEMVVDTSTTAAMPFVGSWEATDVAPIVVCPKEGDVIWHAHPFFVIFLDLFI